MLSSKIVRGLALVAVTAGICNTFAARALAQAPADGPASTLVYFGTYTRGASQGIYLAQLDLAAGKLSMPRLAAKINNPSFLAIHPNHRFLYAVAEVASQDGKPGGSVSGFAIDPESGNLTPLNHESTRGGGPCHLVVDSKGKNVLAANYGGGSVCVLPISGAGYLGEATAFVQHEGSSVNPRRQAGPHAHSINLDPAGRFAFAADLGLDKILIYRFDAGQGTLGANDPAFATVAPGAGPRHFAFHPSGKYAYVINEMAMTVTAFRFDARRGQLNEIQSVPTLPRERVDGDSTAEVQVHPSGKFLYGSNRGHNSIVAYKIDAETGKLNYVGHQSTGGETPRNFGIDPTGAYLLAANQASDSVVVFRIDQQSGKLKPTGSVVKVGSPVCVKFLPVTSG